MKIQHKLAIATVFVIGIGLGFAIRSHSQPYGKALQDKFTIYDYTMLTNGIPATWGRLIRAGDVLPFTDKVYMVHLAFEDDQGTIRLVTVEFELTPKEERTGSEMKPKEIRYRVFVVPRAK